MSSNIPTLSDIIQSSPSRGAVVESPVLPGSRRSSGRFNAQEEVETLSSLSNKRDKLINRRKKLQDDIVLVRLELLELESTVVSTTETIELKRKRQDDELDKLRSQLNKLPIIDNWGLRLSLLRLFQPHLNIEINSIKIIRGLKVIEFELNYRKFFQINIMLKIDIISERIIEFQRKFNNVPTELAVVIRLAQDVASVVFAINSYVRLVQYKIDIWLKIFDKYKERYTINEITSSNELINFIKFKNDSILTIKNDDKQLNIIWNLQIGEYNEFETIIKCILIQDDTTTNFDELINTIIKNDGFYRGICSIIDNTL